MDSITTYLLYLLGLSITIPGTLYLLSPVLPRAAFYARILTSYLSLLLCAAYGVLASIGLRLAGHSCVSQWATGRSFKWVMRLTTGVQFAIEGQEHLSTRPAVFVANHQTELDVLLLGTVFPPYCSVTAKSSLKRVPFLGWFMALSGTVFIDRANRATALAAFEGAAEEMRRERQSVFIFPEGTRSYFDGPDLLPFKKGAFHLAIRAGVPVVPMVAANYSHVLSVRRRVFRAGRIAVKGELGLSLVLVPVRPEGRRVCEVGCVCVCVCVLTGVVSAASDPDGRSDGCGRRRPDEED